MNGNIDCEITRDLLPLYLDNLASSSTRRAVEAHLQDCAQCRYVYEDMKSPLSPIDGAAEREVEYLRLYHRRLKSKKRVIAFLASLLGLLLVFFVTYVYLFGRLVRYDEIDLTQGLEYRRVDSGIAISGGLWDNDLAVSHVRIKEQKDSGNIEAKIYVVKRSFLYRDNRFSVTVPGSTQEVCLQGKNERNVIYGSIIMAAHIAQVKYNEYTSAGHFVMDEQEKDALRGIVQRAEQTDILPDTCSPEEYIQVCLAPELVSSMEESNDSLYIFYEREGLYYMEESVPAKDMQDRATMYSNAPFAHKVTAADYETLKRILLEEEIG